MRKVAKNGKNIRAMAYLYPNPSLKGEPLTDIWGKTYHMKNEPFLELVICGLSPGNYTVELLSPVRLQQSFEAKLTHKTLFFVHPAFADPGLFEVLLRVSSADIEEFALPLAVHKLSGQVRDFKGRRPFPAYVWAVSSSSNSPQAIVKTDSEGRFTLWYPEEKPLRVFIDDESYSQATFECWITAEELKADVRIDPRVGDFELWGLHAWRTQLHWHVYFWPCSLPLDLRAKRLGRLGREFSAPRLKKEEITVRMNGKEVPILGVHRVQVQVGKGRAHVAYLLDLPLTEKEHHPCEATLIQVEVHTAARGRGEAWYITW